MIIGVTGLIGSGKSEVADVFRKAGAILIDCDDIGREVVEKDKEIRYRLVLEFGESILTPGKKLNRRQLGRLAFSTPEKTKVLNDIVHPALLSELDSRLAEVRKKGSHAVVDAALLIYWGYQKKVDYTVLVSSHTRNRIQRLLAGGLIRIEIDRRTRAQLSLSHLRDRSDFVLANNEDLISLRKKAKILYLKLTGRKIG